MKTPTLAGGCSSITIDHEKSRPGQGDFSTDNVTSDQTRHGADSALNLGSAQAYGATPGAWDHIWMWWAVDDYLLPVVSDPSVPTSPLSTIPNRNRGKVPSIVNRAGFVAGIPDWSNHSATDIDRRRWAQDSRLGICMHSQPAFDIDIDDATAANAVRANVERALGFKLPARSRENSGRMLLAFRHPVPIQKQVFATPDGKIELLGNGQQYIIDGTHPTGVRYRWDGKGPGGLPDYVPEVSIEQLADVLALLGFDKPKSATEHLSGDAVQPVITEELKADLRAALRHLAEAGIGPHYGDWQRVGSALKSLGEDGLPLWLEYSDLCGNGEPGDAASKWPDLPCDRTSYKAIFKRATGAGWINPGKSAPNTADGFGDAADALPPPTSLDAFESILSLGKYMLKSTNETWPASSVNRSVNPWPKGPKKVKHRDPETGEVTFIWGEGDMAPSEWLDKNRPIHQYAWMPGQPQIVDGKVMQESGTTDAPGHRAYNLYKPPPALPGDPAQAGPWIDLVQSVYPDHANHIIRWFAHYAQSPHIKVNHGLVLGGPPGIGKDTLLEPIKQGCVGAWNWADISPAAVLGRFNGWAKNIIVRVSEMRDLGDANRFTLYEAMKTYLAAPPDSILVDEKNLREHYVVNVMGLIFTTNNRTDGLYLRADDRRHYVAWSERVKESFNESYWKSIYAWYSSGGIGHVAAYLRGLDLSDFDPKAPPELTRDFWLIVQSGEPPENAEFRDLVDGLEHKDAFTLGDLVEVADRMGMHQAGGDLRDRSKRRTFGHKFSAIGYGAVRNPVAKEGQWVVDGKRQTIYCRLDKPLAEQVRHCRDLQARAVRPSFDPFQDQ